MNLFRILFFSILCTSIVSCSSTKKEGNTSGAGKLKKTSLEAAQDKIYHSGGVANDIDLCPKSPFDTIVPVSSLNDIQSDKKLNMTIDGMQAFVQSNQIKSIEQLLNHFPNHFRTNFSLVEHTKATGQSNLEFPRIVLFGSDGRFLLNVGTKPDDPMYNKLDVAELNIQSGHWEFSVFDFDHSPPKLIRNDPSCVECHGSENSRPVWGDFQEWTGVFGDSVIDGPRPEALDDTHAVKMNEIYLGKGGSARFDFLIWKPALMHRGGFREIAHHDFGPELLLSNVAMGSANALGAYLRLSQKLPDQYRKMRKSMLLSYFKKRSSSIRYPIKINHSKVTVDYSTQMNQKIYQRLDSLDISSSRLDEQLLALGLDTKEAFSMATLHENETPDTSWSLAVSDQYDLLMLQILNEMRDDDAEINRLLTQTALDFPIHGCPDVATNIAQLIDFKMLHLFYLSGEARYKVNWVYYPKDLDDVYDQVFLPISMALIDYLEQS